MSNYIQSTDFAAKDALASGNANKIVKGTEINTEFANIAIAVATKLDSASGAITGATINSSTIGATTPSTGAFTTLSASGATTLSGATTISNAVLPVIDNVKLGYATTATAAGTTTLTVSSPHQQFFTGTTTQTIVLPVTSTLVLGLGYTITNNSTGVLTVQSSGLNAIISIPAKATVKFVCILTSGTTAASWSYAFEGSSNIPYTDLASVSASVGSNALTVTLNPCTLDFRSSTLTSGAVLTRLVPAAISVTVSNGSTLGSVSGVESRLAIIAIDNAGTVELAVVNSFTYGAFDERVLISTTAEGGVGGADSGSVIYSTSARTSVAFRVVGYVFSTQATAGAWATAPSNVNGVGASKMPQDLTLRTAIATTSGTSHDFTDIPSWVKRVTVMFSGVSTNGTNAPRIQLGAGSIETSGYLGSSSVIASGVLATLFSSGFDFTDNGVQSDLFVRSGSIVFTLLGSNTWAANGCISNSDAGRMFLLAGAKTLSGTLDRVRITTVGSTDTFDAGSVNILYE
tara:strand:+ start:11195 stop:12745 length:1551 start_codon:yes stop_codon:yes gene_type:complete